MVDELYEQLVPRRFRKRDMFARFLWILLVVALLTVGVLLIGYLSFMIAIVLILLIVLLIFPRQNVEYEYDLLEHQLDFHIIFSKSRQRLKLSIDVKDAEMILPSDSHRLDQVRADKVYDFSSAEQNAKVYAIVIPKDGRRLLIYFEPDEEMRKRIRRWVRSYTGNFEI